MNRKIKEGLEKLYEFGDFVEAAIDEEDKILYKETLESDIINFLAYLSIADGTVKRQEVNFINEYFGQNFVPDDIVERIDQMDILDDEFAEEPPSSFVTLEQIENFLRDNDISLEGGTLTTYLQFFLDLGKEYLACDNEVTMEESQKLTDYLSMMMAYAKEEYFDENPTFADLDLTKQDKSVAKETEPEESLEELLAQLDSLIGLEIVKKDVISLINFLQIRKMREERGMKQVPMSFHLVFSGNPGTGKTTVARLLAKIYYRLGVLSKGHLVEVDRSQLVGGYVGQTAIKVQEIIQKSLGGILFIDEAYALTANRGENDYGIEAVDTLLKAMEDYRNDFIVIVAGYPELMSRFLNSNPGLRSRFNKFMNFADYNPQELLGIFKNLCDSSGYTASAACFECVKEFFERRYAGRDTNFANGRDVRNYFEIAIVNQANRLAKLSNISDEALSELKIEDVQDIEL